MSTNPPTLRVRLTPAAERQIRCRHPWVFDRSIREQNRKGLAGELAVIYDRKDNFLAVGLYDPESPIRIRILHVGKPTRIDSAWWGNKLRAAMILRQQVRKPGTNGLRWIYGENDGWPGLVLDAYATTLVVKLYSTAWFPHLKEQLRIFRDQFQPERMVLRLSRNIQSLPAPDANPSWINGAVLFGPSAQTGVLFEENGLKFRADVVRGQKTGFFLDHRDNRQEIGALAGGRTVLNLFSFSGGFSLYAARGGARSVTNVDISPHALNECRANWELNADQPGVATCEVQQIQADVFEWLPLHRKQYDIVIMDPPSLARRKADREDALEAYRQLAMEGIRLTRPGGTLLCCSCSAHVSRSDFVQVLEASLRGSGRSFALDRITGHAFDHPTGIPELNYLKSVYLSLRQ